MNSPGYEDCAQSIGHPCTIQLLFWMPSPWNSEGGGLAPWEICTASTLSPGPPGNNGWPKARVTGHEHHQHSASYKTEVRKKKTPKGENAYRKLGLFQGLYELLGKSTCFVMNWEVLIKKNRLLFITSAEVELNYFLKTHMKILGVGHYYQLDRVLFIKTHMEAMIIFFLNFLPCKYLQ